MVCTAMSMLQDLMLMTTAGFAVVGEYNDPKIKEAQNAAFEQMLQWLKSH